MRLNSDCVRDILLTVEKHTDFKTPFQYERDSVLFERLSKYTHEEIIYHIKQCELSNLVLSANYFDGGECIIVSDLSPEGHQFLANIREDTIWKKIKTKAINLGCTSLPSIIKISAKIIEKIIEENV